ncbi:hypothetical protein [Neisseria meningitidis]|uniref:hypothetical protein n=1 Tax=Neisseria meningitidis TaxID=487 RepID=UPI00067B4061|nr:hypothetical protein [Neisseria meningitidis]
MHTAVIPAQAGIQTVIPAQAGIQISMPQEFIGKKNNSNIQRLAEALEILDSHFRGNDAFKVSKFILNS